MSASVRMYSEQGRKTEVKRPHPREINPERSSTCPPGGWTSLTYTYLTLCQGFDGRGLDSGQGSRLVVLK